MIVTEHGNYFFTLNELYLLNSNVSQMFNQINLFNTEITQNLFKMFKLKYGKCHINFLCLSQEFTNEMCEELKEMVFLIFLEYKKKYQKLWESEQFVYNPIDNYNMTETSTDTRTPYLKDKTTYNTTDKRTADLTNKTTYNSTEERTPDITKDTDTEYKARITYTVTDNNTDTESVSAFDSNNFSNNKKNVANGSNVTTPTLGANDKGDTTTVSESETGTDTKTHTGNDKTETTGTDKNEKTGTELTERTGNETTTHTLSRSGNIGVTTTQKMIQSERDIADFSTVTIFMKDIANRLMIGY